MALAELSDDAHDVLSAYLSPVVHDTDGQGWEEVTDCSLTSMLRSALSKKDMANNIVQLESVSEIPQDASRLQKHIALMCDRLGKSDLDR